MTPLGNVAASRFQKRFGVHPGCFAARVRKWLKGLGMGFALVQKSVQRKQKSAADGEFGGDGW